MSNFKKPTLLELRNRAISDLNTYLKGADANLRRRVLNIFATVFAGMGDEILRRVDYLLKQLFIQDADEEFLIKHGQTHRFPRKLPTKANGNAVFSATPGSIVPKGTSFRRADNVLYTSTIEALANAEGVLTVHVSADNTGKDGNAAPGTDISLVSPVAGVVNQGKVDTFGITGGTDIEDIEDYRERLLFFVRNPPTGGSKTDYEIWARQVPGVTRAWCYPTEAGAGTVTVRFMMDDTYKDGIPLSGDVKRVRDYIDKLQPATATVYIEAPIADPLNVVFKSLEPMDTAARAAIKNQLKSLVQSSSVIPGGEIKLSKIRSAISNAAGNEDFVLLAPTSDVVMAKGHITTLGTITYPTPESE